MKYSDAILKTLTTLGYAKGQPIKLGKVKTNRVIKLVRYMYMSTGAKRPSLPYMV